MGTGINTICRMEYTLLTALLTGDGNLRITHEKLYRQRYLLLQNLVSNLQNVAANLIVEVGAIVFD